MQITQQQVGEELLFPLFRCLDDGYKKKYVKDVWEQFENNIRASAYTSKLTMSVNYLRNVNNRNEIPYDYKKQLDTVPGLFKKNLKAK